MPPDDPRVQHLTEELRAAQADLRAVQLDVAELKGSILTELKHLSHDIKNILQALTAFVPRPEIDRAAAAVEEKLKATAKAIEDKADKSAVAKMEEGQTFLRRSLFGSVSLGVVSWVLWFLTKK